MGLFSFLSGVEQMAVPKRKVSRMKRGNRRSADALVAPTYVEDEELGELRRPHHSTSSPANIVVARLSSRKKRFHEPERKHENVSGLHSNS